MQKARFPRHSGTQVSLALMASRMKDESASPLAARSWTKPVSGGLVVDVVSLTITVASRGASGGGRPRNLRRRGMVVGSHRRSSY